MKNLRKSARVQTIFVVAVVLLLALSLPYAKIFGGHTKAKAQTQTNGNTNSVISTSSQASIQIDTSKTKSIQPGSVGVNTPNSLFNISYQNPKYIQWMKDFNRLGYARYPGGTNANFYNWKTGSIDDQYVSQFSLKEPRYYKNMAQKRRLEARGYDRISDFRNFIQQVGTKAMIMVNVFEWTPESAGDLAKYCYDNHIPVIYFELGNEVSFFTGDSRGNLPVFQSATDYLNRMRAFNDAIKKNYPGAKVVISMENNAYVGQTSAYDNAIFNYKHPFWDGVTIHDYKGRGPTLAKGLEQVNQVLDNWDSLINDYYVAHFKDPSMPIYIGELGVGIHGRGVGLVGRQYHGLFMAESILRLSKLPNVKYIAGGGRVLRGMLMWKNSHDVDLNEAYQRNLTVNTNQYDFGLFTFAEALSVKVTVGALNHSTTLWGTKVTGGATVEKSDGTSMPAIYAQAFKGNNGKDYVVVVNKSGGTQHVAVQMDGSNVNKKMTRTWVSSSDPGIRNTIKHPNSVEIHSQTISSGENVLIPAYSVTRLEWDSSKGPAVPQSPWLSKATVNNGKVQLQWYSEFNAKGYKVLYGPSQGQLTHTVDVGKDTSLSVTGLKNGGTYSFAVMAYNQSGESKKSNLVTVQLVKPKAPVITDSHPGESGRAVVEWRSVPGASGYKLKYGPNLQNLKHTIDVGNNVGYIVKGLTNHKKYYFAVTAYNGLGESKASNAVGVEPTAHFPSAPNDLRETNQSSTGVTLEWFPTQTKVAEEDFENPPLKGWSKQPLNGWSIIPHIDSSRHTNVYKSTGDGTAISIDMNGPSGDLEGEATVDVIGDFQKESEAGLIARYQNPKNYYRFVYDHNDDDFKIIKVANGKETVLASVNRKEMKVKVSNPTNEMTLRFKVDGNELLGKVNSKTVLQAKDDTLSGGKFGLYSHDQAVMFDQVRLFQKNATVFNVYRSKNPYSDYTKIASVKGTSFTDTNRKDNQSYYYRVTAVNDIGESSGHSNIIHK